MTLNTCEYLPYLIKLRIWWPNQVNELSMELE